jgi:hypothetical protein
MHKMIKLIFTYVLNTFGIKKIIKKTIRTLLEYRDIHINKWRENGLRLCRLIIISLKYRILNIIILTSVL